MNWSFFAILVGMSLVTYIPRVLPVFMMGEKPLPPFVENVLKNVPYATLGALIFPGILLIHESIWFGLGGAVFAITIAWLGANVLVVVLGSIAFVSVMHLIVSIL
ncbi:AzlD domain-containing protein [Mangrovibacillus cuniculi]|uniref:AzlD domain-containing protein n=1 Tax=Mangrovibacillus cuniculi TaxID=2593652 RepID=A0A7S8C9Q5_9BACI|nr:AzlD domain-containing protein [Mangrovibacillus cuniculi]QPC46014.1 AzlD domain-containing protein [Mangrovibacillus cuniculi]